MIYLDSCAIVKLVRHEKYSSALNSHLASSSADMISSELTKVEVCRTLTRAGQRDATRAKSDTLLAEIAKLPLVSVIDVAANLADPTLRSLDALHLATAQLLGPALTEFITYDKRLGTAAREAGLPVVAPGADAA